MTKIFILKPDATVIFVARSYYFRCTQCGERCISDVAHEPVVVCHKCRASFNVGFIFHTDMQRPIEPGLPQDKVVSGKELLYSPEGKDPNRTPLGVVHLYAAGYRWACPECDPYAENPKGIMTPFLSGVRCKGCGAIFEVSEVRHRLWKNEVPRDMVRHALTIIIKDNNENADADSEGESNIEGS